MSGLNIPLTRDDLPVDAMVQLWGEISPDAGVTSRIEAAELVIDRVSGSTALQVDRLISMYGYDAVLEMTATIL